MSSGDELLKPADEVNVTLSRRVFLKYGGDCDTMGRVLGPLDDS